MFLELSSDFGLSQGHSNHSWSLSASRFSLSFSFEADQLTNWLISNVLSDLTGLCPIRKPRTNVLGRLVKKSLKMPGWSKRLSCKETPFVTLVGVSNNLFEGFRLLPRSPGCLPCRDFLYLKRSNDYPYNPQVRHCWDSNPGSPVY